MKKSQFSKWRAQQERLEIRVVMPAPAEDVQAAIQEAYRWRDSMYLGETSRHPITVSLDEEQLLISFEGPYQAVGA